MLVEVADGEGRDLSGTTTNRLNNTGRKGSRLGGVPLRRLGGLGSGGRGADARRRSVDRDGAQASALLAHRDQERSGAEGGDNVEVVERVAGLDELTVSFYSHCLKLAEVRLIPTVGSRSARRFFDSLHNLR